MSGTKRVFFALWPDDRQRDRLRDFIAPAAKLVEGTAVDRRNWHVTLAFLGEFPDRRLPELHEIRDRVPVEPFRLRFDRLEFWARPRVAVIAAPTVPRELEVLVGELNQRLGAAGIRTEYRSFRPHITVVRKARPFPTERLAQAAVTEWSGFDLMESVAGAGGVTYRPLVKDF